MIMFIMFRPNSVSSTSFSHLLGGEVPTNPKKCLVPWINPTYPSLVGEFTLVLCAWDVVGLIHFYIIRFVGMFVGFVLIYIYMYMYLYIYI